MVALFAELAPGIAVDMLVSGNIHRLVGGSVIFLVVFCTQYAFKMWWHGRVAFCRIVLLSCTIAQQTSHTSPMMRFATAL